MYIYFLKLPRVELPCGKGCSLKYLSYVFDSEFCSLLPFISTLVIHSIHFIVDHKSADYSNGKFLVLYRNKTQPQPEMLVKNCKHN